MANSYYVYALVDPRDGATFYIGKGRGKRCYQHAKDANAGRINNAAKTARIDQITKSGCEVKVEFLYKGLSEAEAIRLECLEIESRKDDLTNLSMGSMERRNSLQVCLDRINCLIARFRTHEQWVVAFSDWYGRTPSKADEEMREKSWEWHLSMREQLTGLIAEAKRLEAVEVRRV